MYFDFQILGYVIDCYRKSHRTIIYSIRISNNFNNLVIFKIMSDALLLQLSDSSYLCSCRIRTYSSLLSTTKII